MTLSPSSVITLLSFLYFFSVPAMFYSSCSTHQGLKLAPDGLEIRNDSFPFESVRATCSAAPGSRWFYEITLFTSAIMQVNGDSRDAKGAHDYMKQEQKCFINKRLYQILIRFFFLPWVAPCLLHGFLSFGYSHSLISSSLFAASFFSPFPPSLLPSFFLDDEILCSLDGPRPNVAIWPRKAVALETMSTPSPTMDVAAFYGTSKNLSPICTRNGVRVCLCVCIVYM